MRTYLLRVFLFTAPLATLLVWMEHALRQVPNDYSFKRDRLLEDGASFQYLVLGNSHAYRGVDPDQLLVPGFNAANSSQSHSCDRAILEKYIDHLPALKHVFIPVSYCSIGIRTEESKEAWRAKNYVIYLGLDEFATHLEYRFELMNRPMPDQVKMLRAYWDQQKDNKLCKTGGAWPKARPKDLDMERSAVAAAKRHYRGTKGNYAQNMRELQRIVTLANAHGIHVHLFAPPATWQYRAHVDPFQFQLSRSIAHYLVRNNSNVSFRDLWSDQRFVDEDFSDADHLGPLGARKLTAILAADLDLGPVDSMLVR